MTFFVCHCGRFFLSFGGAAGDEESFARHSERTGGICRLKYEESVGGRAVAGLCVLQGHGEKKPHTRKGCAAGRVPQKLRHSKND